MLTPTIVKPAILMRNEELIQELKILISEKSQNQDSLKHSLPNHQKMVLRDRIKNIRIRVYDLNRILNDRGIVLDLTRLNFRSRDSYGRYV